MRQTDWQRSGEVLNTMAGRPKKWHTDEPRTTIRVPESMAPRLMALAEWWDSGGVADLPEPLPLTQWRELEAQLALCDRGVLIQEILAYRDDQDALYARIARLEHDLRDPGHADRMRTELQKEGAIP
jgi:hypothetical protein